jgi:hypothetical protein
VSGAPSDELHEVRLLRFPLALWQRTQEHVDELLREFALIAQGEAAHPESVPHRLMELIAELTVAYGGIGAATERERDEAIDRGESEVDLVYRVPTAVTGAVRQLGDMLDEADEYCRQGQHLLTLQAPADQLAFRRWFLSEFLTQLAGAEPVTWPEYEAAMTG